MSIAALAAALLAAQSASPAPPSAAAAASDAPTATAPTAAEASDTPSGAPKDDFGFVNWCKGALTGHMELYPQIKPELDQVEVEKAAKEDPRFTPAQLKAARVQRARDAEEEAKGDAAQAAAGRDYLALYDRAIVAAEKAGGDDLRLTADQAQGQGYRVFSAARAAPARTKMWSWLVWELPARCETAAKTLEAQSDLLGAAFTSGASTATTPALRGGDPAVAAPPSADPAVPAASPQ